MKIMVQKFGGTSVKNAESRKDALMHVNYAIEKGYKIVVVVSAIGRNGDPYATDTLLNLVGGDFSKLSKRELDLLISVGETISASVFTEALLQSGLRATALSGQDAGITTTDDYQNAKVIHVEQEKILNAFKTNDVVVVTGFQGVSESGHITTLGRGGSDTSAAILGAALAAERVDIFTDVAGVMTADPRLVKQAKFIHEMSYQEIANLAHEGAKVVHPRAVEIAQQANLPLRVRSTHNDVQDFGTLVTKENLKIEHYRLVTGIAHVPHLTQFKIPSDQLTPDAVFSLMSEAGLSVDFINILPDATIYTLNQHEATLAKELFEASHIEAQKTSECAKVAIVGAGITGIPGVMAKITTTLVKNEIPILQTTDSYTTIWVLVHQKDLEKALNALHDTFL